MSEKHRRYEALIGALMPDLFRYAYWLCGQKPLAEDLVQETLLRAWRSLDSLRDEGSAKYWLFTILRRERARYYERRRLETVDIDDVPVVDDLAIGPDGEAELDNMRRVLHTLEEDYREPLMLQVLMGYSVEEIAQVMEMNKATVLTRLFRARKKMAAAMDSPGNHLKGIGNE